MSAPVIGVVLAGGLSRRMGGGDKGLRRLAGASVLDHAVARLSPQCAALVLNANGDPARFAFLGLPVAADTVPGHPGPLAGILAGMEWAAAHRADIGWIASVPGDCPFLPADLVARLRAGLEAQGAEIAVAASGGRTHPVAALWPVARRAALRHALVEEGSRKVGAWVARHRVAVVEWPAGPVDPFFNVNTADDLAEAERLAKAVGD